MHADLRLGGHVSLGSKPETTLRRLRDEGYKCLQIHASSPRTWRIPSDRLEWTDMVRRSCQENGLELYLHSIYLINLASEDETIWRRSIELLRWNLSIAGALGATAVTFHLGSHRGRGFDDARRLISGAIEKVLVDAPEGPLLLIENSAGAGDCIGGLMEEIGVIMADAGHPQNLRCCVDTAHAFAMGYDIRSAEGLQRMLDEVDGAMGLHRLAALHLNDSMTDLGALRDRHENIGCGCIGEIGFANILANSSLQSLPMILETPNPERRPGELELLRKLAGQTELARAAA